MTSEAMSSEIAFRIAVVLIVLPTIAITAYYRWQAATGECISHREEGYVFAVALRLSALCLAIGALAYLLDPPAVGWAMLPLPAWIRWCGAVLGPLCWLLMYWTLASLGKNLTDTVVTRARATLVTHGPYRWVRHPFYLTTALLMSSISILSANWFLGLTGLIVIGMLAIRTAKEEQRLIDKFGDEYRRYAQTTGKFFPRVSR